MSLNILRKCSSVSESITGRNGYCTRRVIFRKYIFHKIESLIKKCDELVLLVGSFIFLATPASEPKQQNLIMREGFLHQLVD